MREVPLADVDGDQVDAVVLQRPEEIAEPGRASGREPGTDLPSLEDYGGRRGHPGLRCRALTTAVVTTAVVKRIREGKEASPASQRELGLNHD